MNLTSLERARTYLGLTDKPENNREVLTWIPAVSRRIETFLDRELESKIRTQFFDTTYNRLEYFPKATPVTTITSIKSDSQGLFTGSETTLTNFYIGTDENSVVLDFPEVEVKRGLQLIYTGGLATSGTQSVFAVSSVTGTWTVGLFVKGLTSNSIGIIRVAPGTSITIDNLYGVFEIGEVLNEFDTELLIGTSDGVATIDSITSQSLAESDPDIVRAVEIELRYLRKHKNDLENVGTSKDSTSRRSTLERGEYGLQPEAIALLTPFRRMFVT